MKKLVSIFLSAVIICGLLLISACDRTEDVRKSDGKISVVTTIFPYYDFVRQLGGDKVDIRLLLSPGSDPHSYEPKPSDITAIENCDIFICNGGESDEWVDGVLSSIENKDVKVMKMMEYDPLRHEQSMDHDHDHDSHEDMDDDDEGHNHEEGEKYDEHVWTSIRNAERMSASIADELMSVDSKNSKYYNDRKTNYISQLDSLDKKFTEWDGTDRVSALARRVSDDPVWVNGFHRWMLGLSAQWMQLNPDNNRANSVAPLLVSSRQGLGKSTFCRLLMPDRLKSYYTESYDLSSPASAEAKLAAYGLINLDEFDKLGASKMPLLKNLMQASALNIRKAYKHSASSLPRIASFIGTSNREDLLVDRTGSRRFLCVSLKHAIDCTTSVEHKQLYAQLKTELLSGERSWFNKEEEQTIQQHNALFYKHVPEEEVFRLCFRFATEEDNPQEVLSLSATQLFERM